MMNKKTMHLVKNPNVMSDENESFLFTSFVTDLEKDLSEDKIMTGFDDDMEDDDDDDDDDMAMRGKLPTDTQGVFYPNTKHLWAL